MYLNIHTHTHNIANRIVLNNLLVIIKFIFRQSHNWVRRDSENKQKKSSAGELKQYSQEADKLFENLEGTDFKVSSASDINQLRCLAHLLESMVSFRCFRFRVLRINTVINYFFT